MKFCIYSAILLIILYILEVKSVTREERKSFRNFKIRYNKRYTSGKENRRRLKIYSKNAAFVQEHNLKRKDGHETFTLALNEYADMTPDEFQSLSQSYSLLNDVEKGANYVPPFNVKPPNEIDWRILGAVTPVRRQFKCGACYAFSAVAALEGQHFRKTSELITLSVQNLIDCVPLRNNINGCRGGSKERSFTYVHDNNGIATEESYPYLAMPNNECLFNTSVVGEIGKGFVNIPPGDEMALTLAVATVGPIAVVMNIKCLKIQFFKNGIFNDEDCSPTAPLTHAVLLVGYGHDNETNMDYWIVKNSWGTKWGIDGYMYIPRFINYAGVANRASYPLV